MRYGLDVATSGDWSDVRVLAQLAADAEVAGWDGFFVWDLLLGRDNAAEAIADPWIALTAIALATSRMRIGALVTPLARRRPAEVARQVAILDRLSGGRMILGAGLGWQDDDFTRLGEDPDRRLRAAKLDESLEAIAELWLGQPVWMTGRHVRIEGAILLPTPLQRPRVPVWLAAGWPRRVPLERAARWDGLCLMTANQATGDPLAATEVAEAVRAVMGLRGDHDRPFDVTANYFLDEPQGAAALEEAGATWAIGLTPETLDEHRTRIRAGPQRG